MIELATRALLVSMLFASWVLPALDHHAIERMPGHLHVFFGSPATAARSHETQAAQALLHPEHHHDLARTNSAASASDASIVGSASGVGVAALPSTTAALGKLVGAVSPALVAELQPPAFGSCAYCVPTELLVRSVLPSVPHPPPRVSMS